MSLPSKVFACLLIATPLGLAGTASAAPIGGPLGLHAAAGTAVETVQWRRWGGWRGGPGWGWGGLAAGAIIGGAIAASQPWYGYDYAPGYYGYSYAPGYSYGYDPGYSSYGYDPGYSYGYSSGAGDVAYCMQRFRSYDPASRTYLGYDGIRHPCP